MEKLALKILIVEDDLLFGLELEMLVQEIGYQVVALVDNSAEALELIYSESPDLILMDIDIKGRMNGLEIGEKIKHLKTPLLYITSFDDQKKYQQAEQTNSLGYLVKPVGKFTLRTSIGLAMQNLRLGGRPDENDPAEIEGEDGDFRSEDYLFFKKKGVYHKVHLLDIHYVEADGDYTLSYLADGEKFISRSTLGQLEKLLPKNNFLRIHRSFIVNLSKVESIDFQSNTLYLTGRTLPLSRQKKQELKKLIQHLE